MQYVLEPDVVKRLVINQILTSEWMAMDQRLLILTPAEKTAMNVAQEERKKITHEVMSKTAIKVNCQSSVSL